MKENTMAKTINEMSDAELARMVRESVYAKNTQFGDGPTDAQYLLVLAVPYGKDEDVESLSEAIDEFARLLQDDDWQARQFQVYNATSNTFYEQSRESCDE